MIASVYLATVLTVCSYGAYIKNEDDPSQELMVLPPAPAPRASLHQIFRDDFNSLDKNQWTPYASAAQGGHNEFEIYSPDTHNCYARGGILYLRPTLTKDRFGDNFLHHGVLDVKKQWGYCKPTWNNGCYRDAKKDGIMPPIMSCMLQSKISFKYGKLEIVAQMPRGDWLWPALWLMPQHSRFGGWPKSGEFDIAETTGNLNYGKAGVQRATASLHFGTSREAHKHISGEQYVSAKRLSILHEDFNQSNILHGTSYGHAFHKYTLDWTASHIKMYVDDILLKAVPTPSDGMHHHYQVGGSNIWGNSHNAPFDQDFYILMNVAVGGLHGMFGPWARNYPHPMPWSNDDSGRVAMEKFWNHKNEWYSTWHGEDAAMRVDSVTIWTY